MNGPTILASLATLAALALGLFLAWWSACAPDTRAARLAWVATLAGFVLIGNLLSHLWKWAA